MTVDRLPSSQGPSSARHAARGEAFLRRLGADPAGWVRDVGADHDVVVVGGGQAGLAIGFALRRAGIARHSVIDAAGPDDKGVWTTTARMHTLRTPKAWPEPEFGHPELSFRAWFEDEHGQDAYERLDRIPRLAWADYLRWIERTLRVPVRHRTRLVRVEPEDDRLTLTLAITSPDGSTETIRETTRKLVLANGVEGTGGPNIPAALRDLPAGRALHTGDSIDAAQVSGRRVGVIGAGASALDVAGWALETGATEVHLFTRRPELILQGPAGFGPAQLGARDHYQRRPDADRWRQKVLAARQGRSATLASLERALEVPGLVVHVSAPVEDAVLDADSDDVLLTAADGTHRLDVVVAGTGYQYDPATRAELDAVAPHVALWRDRYEAPADLQDDGLGANPYLGPAFELTEREPGRSPWVGRIHTFSAAAGMSFGYPVGDAQSLAPLVPVLVDGIGRDLFLEDQTLPEPATAQPVGPLKATSAAAISPPSTETYVDRYAHVLYRAPEPATTA